MGKEIIETEIKDDMEDGLGLITTDVKEGEDFEALVTGDIYQDAAELPEGMETDDKLSHKITVHNEKTGESSSYVLNTGIYIGQGNQSRIYSCNGDDGKERVIKIYNKVSKKKIEGFLEILETLKNGSHENICNIIEYGQCVIDDEEKYCVIMEKYHQSLEKEEQDINGGERGKFKWKGVDDEHYRRKILSFVEQMNDGLRYIHSKQIYHSDVKPANIVTKPEGRYVLIDFGGAVRADEYGSTVPMEQGTPIYMPSEALAKNARLGAHTDYYSFGTVLLEVMNGSYPKTDISEEYGETIRINNVGYRAPKSLPKHYVNLIKGLCYDGDDPKENRWTCIKVMEWLECMRTGNVEKAASIGVIAPNVTEIEPAKEKKNFNGNEYIYEFGTPVSLDMGDETKPYYNLNDVCDAFAIYWREGIDILRKDDEKSLFRKVDPDKLALIEKGRDGLYVDLRKGQSINAGFFKFIYKYKNDKKTFYWVDLPNINTIEQLAAKLYVTINRAYKEGGEFGDWTEKEPDGKKKDTKIFAEILCNDVLSTYLKAAKLGDENVFKQCKKVERIFKDKYINANADRSRCSNDEMVELYTLVRMLTKSKTYTMADGSKYNSYEEFKHKITTIVTDKERVREFDEIMRTLKNNSGELHPDFTAWRILQGA